MKLFAYTLLISQAAATPLAAVTLCVDAATNTALTAVDTAGAAATTVQQEAVFNAAVACASALELGVEEVKTKGNKIEVAAAYPANNLTGPELAKVKESARVAFTIEWMKNLDLFGAALGMGKLSCVYDATCTDRVALKGTFGQQQIAYVTSAEYAVAQWKYCLLPTAKATCNADGYTKLVEMGTAMAKDDFFEKTVAERTTWRETQDKANVAAATAALKPAAPAVGADCKAAAAAAGETTGKRPDCGTANCCMGYKKAVTDTANSAETCQDKTLSKGMVVTTDAKAVANAGYIEVTAAVSEEQSGACIEGAMRAASAAASVLAAIYMMA